MSSCGHERMGYSLLSILLSFALGPIWTMFLNFSCFCSFAQLSQCICHISIGPARTSSGIPSSGGRSILHHHLLTQRLPSLCCHSSSNMSLSGHLSHCSYVFPYLFLHLSESLEGQGIYLFQLCISSCKLKGLVQSMPREV